MSYMEYAEHADILLDTVGPVIANAFTQSGLDKDGMIRSNSALGRVRMWGNVHIGNPEKASQEKPFSWPVDPAAESSVWYGPNDAYTADTKASFGKAELEWKRTGTPIEYDDLVNITGGQTRAGVPIINRRWRKKMQAITAGVNTGLFTDGTGSSGKIVTGFKAALSDSNTYAGIAQSGNLYWQAVEITASAALTKSHLKDCIGGLWDREVIEDGSHEIWMGRAVWEQYVALYNVNPYDTANQDGGDRVAAWYNDGEVRIEIVVMPGMPSGEIWVMCKEDTMVVFADQVPKSEPADERQTAIMQEGIPIGIKPVYNNSDISGFWVRAYLQARIFSPRNFGIILAITV